MSDDNKCITNVTSHNQAGGITAGTVNIGTIQRRVTDADIALFRENLPKGARITVVSQMNDNEAAGFAWEIEQWLTANGYTDVHAKSVMRFPPMRGRTLVKGSDGYQILIGSQ